jgi:hypothetical protein
MTTDKFTRILQHFIADRGLFQYGDGRLKLIGIYGRVTPVLTTIILERLLEQYLGKKKAIDLLYLLGESQSYVATRWAVERVGIPLKGNEIRIFNEVASHSQLTGHGKHRLIRFDMKNKVILVSGENNVFCSQYKALFGKQKEAVDHFGRGLIGGVGKFLFGEEIITICEECPSMGCQKSIYRIVPLNGAVEKYGPGIKKLVPDPKLRHSILQVLRQKNILL